MRILLPIDLLSWEFSKLAIGDCGPHLSLEWAVLLSQAALKTQIICIIDLFLLGKLYSLNRWCMCIWGYIKANLGLSFQCISFGRKHFFFWQLLHLSSYESCVSGAVWMCIHTYGIAEHSYFIFIDVRAIPITSHKLVTNTCHILLTYKVTRTHWFQWGLGM